MSPWNPWDAMKRLWRTYATSVTFEDTDVHGVVNLVQIAPRLWRMGQPRDDRAWAYLSTVISPPSGDVTVVKLNDAAEGSDAYARDKLGWHVVEVPIPPKDDVPASVFELPTVEDVDKILQAVCDAYHGEDTVVIHCSHGKDRTGLVSGLVGMKLLGWSKAAAWQNMLDCGFRWELPDLDLYWEELWAELPTRPSRPNPLRTRP